MSVVQESEDGHERYKGELQNVSYMDMERRVLAEYAKFNTRRLKAPMETSEDEANDVDELSNATKPKE
jgi:hypothetical protein